MKKWHVFGSAMVVVGASVWGVACSKGPAQLTGEQKAQLQELMGNLSQVNTEVGKLKAKGSSEYSKSEGEFSSHSNHWDHSSIEMPRDLEAASDSSASRSRVRSLHSRLQSSIDNEACVISIKSADSHRSHSSSSPTGNGSISLSGDQCPIWLKSELAMSNSHSSFTMVFSLSYQARSEIDSDLAQSLDIQSASLNMKMAAIVNPGDSGRLSLDFNGYIQSQKYGRVTISSSGSISADRNGGGGAIVMDFQFPSFLAEAKIAVDGRKVNYTLNGEAMSESDFKKLFNGSVPGMDNMPSSSDDDSGSPSSDTN